MNISDRDIARVREAVPIAEIARLFTALQPTGDGNLLGLCPFHAETRPSFQVTPARGMWFCFGCGEGGDVISLAEKGYKLSFGDAVQRLADRAGIVIDANAPNPAAIRAARAFRAGIPEAIEQRDVDSLINNMARWLATDTDLRAAALDHEEQT